MKSAVKRALLILIALLAFSKVEAQEWTGDQKQKAVILGTLHAMDWLQTRYIARHPELFQELNPFLGSHPSIGRVNSFFVVTSVIGYYILDRNERYRDTGLNVFIAVKGGVVARNLSIGVKFSW